MRRSCFDYPSVKTMAKWFPFDVFCSRPNIFSATNSSAPLAGIRLSCRWCQLFSRFQAYYRVVDYFLNVFARVGPIIIMTKCGVHTSLSRMAREYWVRREMEGFRWEWIWRYFWSAPWIETGRMRNPDWSTKYCKLGTQVEVADLLQKSFVDSSSMNSGTDGSSSTLFTFSSAREPRVSDGCWTSSSHMLHNK